MQKFLRLFVIYTNLVGALFVAPSCNGVMDELPAPTHLKVDLKTNPLGIDNPLPQFSWISEDTTQGAWQSAYQILVATSPEKLNRDQADVWNSGKIKSDQSAYISFSGKELSPAKRYFWTVRTWNREGHTSAFSEPAFFETAFLSKSDWKALWIGEDATQKPLRSLALRKEFELPTSVESARIYVTGLGGYVLFINGEKVGDELLSPGWTHYPKKVQYQIYDVTQMLAAGQNALGAYLGNQWWSSGLGWGTTNAVYSDGPLRLLAQLEITFTDGSKQTIITDESWKVNDSPVVENTLYHGEIYDARLEEDGWCNPRFDDSHWRSVILVDVPEDVRLVAQQAPPIRITEELTPISIDEVKPGVFVFDLGQNMVGSLRLKVNGKQGDKIVMKFAELIHPDGTVAQENLRSAKAVNTYILKGEDTEVWSPYFTYHGYRYVQVEGLTQNPDHTTLTGLVFHTDSEWTGSFACSDELLNRIQKNIFWGTRGNLMEVPTDCPQRDERLGWMGDAQIFAATANYNTNLATFWRKWQHDILDCQSPEGWVYDVNPAIVVDGPAKPGWGDAVVIVPWENYVFFGDKQILSESYEGMKAWVLYMQRQSRDDIYEWGDGEWGGFGDWVPVENSPTKPIGGIYYYFTSHLMSKIANILGKKDDAAFFDSLSVRIATAYHNKYFLHDEGEYIGKTQTANLLPLAVGIVPQDLRKSVAGKIAQNAIARNNHLTTGFLGTKYLLPILSDYGYHDVAFEIAVQKSYPSWGYMIEQGATTMWELWNSDTEKPEGMNSRNHFAYGSVGEWYYSHLAGIKPVAEYPGFKKSIVAPKPVGDLTWVKADVGTIYGKLSSHWELKDNELLLNVRIPANTTSQIVLPKTSGKRYRLLENRQPVYENGSFRNKLFSGYRETEEEIIFQIPAGNWQFSLVEI
jgi:alpha-L-rhamnosidase